MPFRFRKTVRVGPVRLNFGKRGFTSLGVGRTTFRKGYTPRTSIPTGISGLSFQAGGKRTKAAKTPAPNSNTTPVEPRHGGRLRRWFFYALGGLVVLCMLGALFDNDSERETASAPAEISGPTRTARPTATAQAEEGTPLPDAAALLPPAQSTAELAATEQAAPTSTPSIVETAAPLLEAAGPPRGVAARTANVRDQPTSEGSTVIGSVVAGESLTLRRRTPDGTWLAVVTPGGVIGWVSAGLLTVAPEVAAALPAGTTDDAITVRPTAVPQQAPAAQPPVARGGSFDPVGEDCPANAPIKGNINRDKEYIYHMPGQQAYTRTIPEQCFATAAQAQAAGFRAAKR